jgi:hypothetical protein
MAIKETELQTQTAELPVVNHIQPIELTYEQYLSDQAIVHMLSQNRFPTIEILNESRLFQEFSDVVSESFQQRAFDLGVRKGQSVMQFKNGSLEEKMRYCIEYFEGTNMTNPHDNYASFDGIGKPSLFFVITGTHLDEYTDSTDAPLENFINDEELYNEAQALFQIGVRLSILRSVVSYAAKSYTV